MHFIIYSHAPQTPTGFGTQTHALAKKLQSTGHTISVVAINYHLPPITYDGIEVLPTRPTLRESPEDLYYWANEKKPDKIIQFFDAWAIGRQWIKPEYNIVCYNPVDCEGLPRGFKEGCDGAIMNVAMSKHAEKTFMKEGIEPYCYIPHAFNINDYKEDKKKARKSLRLPEDAFIFGLFATNLTPRKNIAGQMEAFAMFLKETIANAFLYLHTNVYEQFATSYDIKYLIKKLNLTGRILVPDQHKYLLGLHNKDYMKNIYNAIDVLLCCSYGEGFGIPIIEAQACGKPTIVTDGSSMIDVAGKGAISIRTTTTYIDPIHNGTWVVPNTLVMKDIMLRVCEDKTVYKKLSEEALENANKYDWSIWLPEWLKILEN